MNNLRPLLSIVIPIYNVQEYLPRLVKCLSEQRSTQFETVFVDDGSTDMSYDVLIQEVENLKNKVTIIQQDNAGLSSARNTGIANSVGEYIFFLDSDDEVVEDFVHKIVKIINADNRPDAILFDYSSINEEGKYLDSSYGHGDIYKHNSLVNSNVVLNALSKAEIPITAWSFVVKKSILTKNEILFSVGKKFEDVNFTPKVLYFSNNIRVISEKMYKYRQRSSSIMATFSDKDAVDAIFVIKDLYNFAKAHPSSSLNAVVGRETYTNVNRFLGMNIVYKNISPILYFTKADFVKQNIAKSTLIKLWIFRYFWGYKLYSSIKRIF